MSGINVSYNMSNAIGNEMGEATFEGKVTERSTESAKSIVGGVINEILENAVDIALAKKGQQTLTEGQYPFDFSGNLYDVSQTSPAIREIIEGLSSIHAPIKTNAEEPLPLDLEMKRLLTEMMSPPYEIVNYETVPRKNGVGDQSTDLAAETIELIDSQDNLPGDNQKMVEKKSRVTDLVMNSKKILTNLLDDEAKKNLDDWEIEEEQEINVIELQDHPFKTNNMEGQIDVIDAALDTLDVCAGTTKKESNFIDTASMTEVGEGDKVASNNIEDAGAKDSGSLKSKEKKKKKWSSMLKFLGIKKKVPLERNNAITSAISNP